MRIGKWILVLIVSCLPMSTRYDKEGRVSILNMVSYKCY